MFQVDENVGGHCSTRYIPSHWRAVTMLPLFHRTSRRLNNLLTVMQLPSGKAGFEPEFTLVPHVESLADQPAERCKATWGSRGSTKKSGRRDCAMVETD